MRATSVTVSRGLAACALVAVFACGVPWEPLVDTSLYEYQVHLAHVMRCQWGVDVVSTYGPWGFIGLSVYHPDTFPCVLLLNGLILCITALRINVFIAQTFPGARWAGGLFTVTCLLLLTPIVRQWTAVLFCAQLLSACVVLEWLMGKLPSSPWPNALTAAALGFLALVKISVWPIAFMVGIGSWVQPGPRRWAFTACMLAGALSGWLAAGQSLLHLGAFVRTGVDVIAGYGNEMTIWRQDLLPSALFLGAVLGLMALIAWLYWPKTLPSVVGLLTLGGLFGSLFQSGFIRADRAHVGSSFMAATSLVPLLFAAAWAVGTQKGRAAAVGMVLCCLALLPYPLATQDYHRPEREARGLIKLLRGRTQELPMLREDHLSRLRASHQLGPPEELAGAGGILGGDIGILEGNHARFTLQPTLTTYSAYMPSLQSLNASWIARADGLVWLLWCSPGPVDSHYPGETDSRAMVALLTHFTFVRQVGDCTLLRRTAPLTLVPRRPLRQTLRLGQVLMLPAGTEGLVLAEITVQETLLGKLVHSLLKPAPLFLQVSLRDGRVVTHLVMPPVISQGFLLSPYPSSWQTLEAQTQGLSQGDSISALRLHAWSLGSISSDYFYKPEVKVALTPLSKPAP